MATIARMLGLSVPDYGIVRVGPIFANGVGHRETRELLARNVGDHFASVLVSPGISAWDPACTSTSASLRVAMDGVMSFDAAVMNADRGARNPNLLWDGQDALHMIDHGLACPVYRWPDDAITASPPPGDAMIQAHAGYPFLKGQGTQFAYTFGNWSASLTPERLAALRALVPPDWEQRAGDLDRIFTFLAARSSKFLDVATSLRRVVQ